VPRHGGRHPRRDRGAENEEGQDLGRTMGMTTFAIANLLFSFTVRDALRSVFSLDTFNDRRFIIASLASAAAIILATELSFFHRILDSVELTGNQWLICIGAASTIVVVSEIWKFGLRRRESAAERAEEHTQPDSTAGVRA
jgi:P-type Ca2+ transporter type 2C